MIPHKEKQLTIQTEIQLKGTVINLSNKPTETVQNSAPGGLQCTLATDWFDNSLTKIDLGITLVVK